MTGIVPIARTDRAGRRYGTPLAGSRHVWFGEVAENGDIVPTPPLTEEATRLWTGLRPDLCGLTLDRPRVMGILNVTPDSFSDGGDHVSVMQALARARTMADEADIIDIGGESTRPGAAEVPVEAEIRRTVPVIRAIRAAGIVTPISIDTRKAEVAAAALEAGADMVNDVSALEFDPDMAVLVAARGVPVCLMHAKGTPETMQNDPTYADVVAEVADALAGHVDKALAAGIDRDNIVVDPGIGFGKTLDHNIALLRNLTVLHGLGLPVLLGASRKRFIGTLGDAPEAKDRLGGSLSVALHAAAQGVQIIRVHDTKETCQALALWQALATHEDEQT